MLENSEHGTNFQSTSDNSVRKTWVELLRSFFSNFTEIPRRLSRMGKRRVPGRLDEEIPKDVPYINKIETMSEVKIPKTREEQFSESHFEWVKTEREGDVSKFKGFEIENDIEYTVFVDNTRIRTDLIGDVILRHQHESEILGIQPLEHTQPIQPIVDITAGLSYDDGTPAPSTNVHTPVHASVTEQPTRVIETDPVVAILEKTKKKTEKVIITLSLKIPSLDLYNVIKENFDNTDEILLQSVMEQLKDDLLQDALKKELQNIYQKKRKV